MTIVAIVVVLVAAVPALLFFPDWYAERRARAFCNEIEVGSDISVTLEKADRKKILHGFYRWHTFYFPGLMFNKAVCEVSVSQDGKVTQKGSSMEYD